MRIIEFIRDIVSFGIGLFMVVCFAPFFMMNIKSAFLDPDDYVTVGEYVTAARELDLQMYGDTTFSWIFSPIKSYKTQKWLKENWNQNLIEERS